MSFELTQLPDNKNEKSLDDQWYEKFSACGSFEDYEYLNGDKDARENQKNDFIQGKCENPTLDYPDLEKINIKQKEEELLSLKKDILEQEQNETVKQIYRWKINQKIAELRMLEATKNNNNRRFVRYSEFIYGKPEKEIFNYTLNQIKKVIDKKINDPNDNIRQAAQRLLDEFSPAFEEQSEKLEELKDFVKNNSESEEVADIQYNSEEIKNAFEQALEEYKLKGWDVLITEKGTSIRVSQENKSVQIPSNKQLKQKNLQSLIRHEIGTHVLRRENGERSRLKLLGLGLDRYLKGEEGIATFEEQKILGASEFTGLEGHLAISLALGMDGKKRNFRQVYEILKDYNFIKSKKEESEAMEYAQRVSWNRCVRTFKGTACDIPGICFTKDIVYREGNIGIWDVVKNNPEEVKRFTVGKYDPSNPRHIWILEQLGINDEDLKSLEQ